MTYRNIQIHEASRGLCATAELFVVSDNIIIAENDSLH